MITVGMLLKNESKRWLTQVLQQAYDLTKDRDRIIIVDDNSTDKTVQICKNTTKRIHLTKFSMWEKNERFQRERLFNECLKVSNVNDWIFIIDADEVIEDVNGLREFILASDTTGYDALNFLLFDMWNDTHYRDDKLWDAHKRQWTFAVKAQNINYKWKNTKLHCGRFPLNAVSRGLLTKGRIKHLGWSTEEIRKKKYDRYIKLDKDGQLGDLRQYESIMDEKPNLIEFKK